MLPSGAPTFVIRFIRSSAKAEAPTGIFDNLGCRKLGSLQSFWAPLLRKNLGLLVCWPTWLGKDAVENLGTPWKTLVCWGKGGVGKSTVSAQLSFGFSARSMDVGLLDVDICGPSVPRMLGLLGQDVHQSSVSWRYSTVQLGRLRWVSDGSMMSRPCCTQVFFSLCDACENHFKLVPKMGHQLDSAFSHLRKAGPRSMWTTTWRWCPLVSCYPTRMMPSFGVGPASSSPCSTVVYRIWQTHQSLIDLWTY